MWTIPVSGIPMTPNQHPGHWTVRHGSNKRFKEEVAWQALALANRYGTFSRARVRIMLSLTGTRYMDDDNAIATVKSLVDGLVAGKLLSDDARKNITLTVQQEKGQPARKSTIYFMPMEAATDEPNKRKKPAKPRSVTVSW